MASEKKMLLLRSSDGKVLEVSEEVIGAASATIKRMISADATLPIPIPKVTAATLSRVLQYVNKHFDPAAAAAAQAQPDDHRFSGPHGDHPLAGFDNGFVDVDNDTLIDLVAAAEYLGIEKMLDLTCEALAERLKGKSIDEIRKAFGIVNDYTTEEEEEVRRENSWAFD